MNREQRRHPERFGVPEGRTLAEPERPSTDPADWDGTGQVAIAYICPGKVEFEFCRSLTDTIAHDARYHGWRIIGAGGGTISMMSGTRIAAARTDVVKTFLTDPAFIHPVTGRRAEWLWMVDADMHWEPEAFDTLIAHAHPEHVPILGGLCFAGGANLPMYPTIYREVEDEAGGLLYFPEPDYPRDALVKCGATGAAFLLVHIAVFLRMLEVAGRQRNGEVNPYPWFVEGLVDSRGQGIGEDIAFCRRARLLGIPTHVHTGIRVGHLKRVELTEHMFDRERDMAREVVMAGG